jgi:hypothetical protein
MSLNWLLSDAGPSHAQNPGIQRSDHDRRASTPVGRIIPVHFPENQEKIGQFEFRSLIISP